MPAQDFVDAHGIASVVGFGGALPSGFVFAVVMFATVEVPAETAASFAPLTFATQLALLPFVEGRVFRSSPPVQSTPDRDLRLARAKATTLGHLLDTRQEIVLEQARRLEQALQDAEERAEALARSRRRLHTSEATKAAILDAALDAVITMDAEGAIVDFNPAAEAVFGYPREEAVGTALADLVIPERYRQAHREGLARYLETGEGAVIGRRIEISALRSDGSEFPVELAIAPILAEGRQLFSGHIRDITEPLRAAEALRAAGERYAEIARILQASLLPPELPVVPGLDIAAAYVAAATGLEVGGDFYDLFQIDEDRWGVVLGDVMGKGAEAAVTTALARYTVRAAAIRSARPTEVLSLLNEAIHRSDPYRFCTAAFGFVDVGPEPRLTVAIGGHPRPLLVTGEGVVRPLEASGRLLGPFEEWQGDEQAVCLTPGDLVLFYSDGVTEARRDGEEFGTDRLAALVAREAGGDAKNLVDAIVTALTDFGATSVDDVALLAIRLPG